MLPTELFECIVRGLTVDLKVYVFDTIHDFSGVESELICGVIVSSIRWKNTASWRVFSEKLFELALFDDRFLLSFKDSRHLIDG